VVGDKASSFIMTIECDSNASIDSLGDYLKLNADSISVSRPGFVITM
jgi:hypothetical protein